MFRGVRFEKEGVGIRDNVLRLEVEGGHVPKTGGATVAQPIFLGKWEPGQETDLIEAAFQIVDPGVFLDGRRYGNRYPFHPAGLLASHQRARSNWKAKPAFAPGAECEARVILAKVKPRRSDREPAPLHRFHREENGTNRWCEKHECWAV